MTHSINSRIIYAVVMVYDEVYDFMAFHKNHTIHIIVDNASHVNYCSRTVRVYVRLKFYRLISRFQIDEGFD